MQNPIPLMRVCLHTDRKEKWLNIAFCRIALQKFAFQKNKYLNTDVRLIDPPKDRAEHALQCLTRFSQDF